MTLVNRVSLFFLAALAVGLAGYSTLSYLLIRDHLYEQFDRQLAGSLNVIVAALEVEPDSVKWQPSDHTITLGDEGDADEVRWVLVDQAGSPIDRSRNLDVQLRRDQALIDQSRVLLAPPGEALDVPPWRIMQVRLAAPQPSAAGDREADEFAAVTVTVARDFSHLRTELLRLALLVIALPAALWIMAAILGRAFCQRALAPVRTMAAQARSIKQPDFTARLPLPPQRDELAELGEAFNGLLVQLQQAFDQQQRFTGDAAHQLRTPLTVLLGQIDVALRRPRSETEYRETLATLREHTLELERIVAALLFLARATDDGAPPSERLELDRWLSQYATRWRDHPRAEDLRWHAEPGLADIASPSLLAQALDNLVSNALKYSPAGSPVAVSAAGQGDQARIAVVDRGPGIDPAEREDIFEPFFRSAQARRSGIEGTGLGLALVARIARALGGQAACEPSPGAGTRFTLTFPAACTSGGPLPANPPRPEKSPIAPS